MAPSRGLGTVLGETQRWSRLHSSTSATGAMQYHCYAPTSIPTAHEQPTLLRIRYLSVVRLLQDDALIPSSLQCCWTCSSRLKRQSTHSINPTTQHARPNDRRSLNKHSHKCISFR